MDEGRAFLDGATPPQRPTQPCTDIVVHPAHRPSTYTPEIGNQICEKIAEGKTLREACALVGKSKTTVFRWLLDEDKLEFRRNYALALEFRAETFADELVEIADDGSEDFRVVADGDGAPRLELNREHIARSKIRIETRQWLMGKMQPKKYGEEPPPALPPPPNGDNAHELNPRQPQVLEADPMEESMAAWRDKAKRG